MVQSEPRRARQPAEIYGVHAVETASLFHPWGEADRLPSQWGDAAYGGPMVDSGPRRGVCSAVGMSGRDWA